MVPIKLSKSIKKVLRNPKPFLRESKEENGEKTEINSLQKQLQEKELKITELTELMKRIQADADNGRKRIEKEKQEFVVFANKELVAKLLPVLDSFEIALKNSGDAVQFKKGAELIYAQLFTCLEQQGLKQINALGKKFDPFLHEALLRENSEKKEIVLEELQKGYMLNGRIIRITKVKVGV